jgi:hypothetical protein
MSVCPAFHFTMMLVYFVFLCGKQHVGQNKSEDNDGITISKLHVQAFEVNTYMVWTSAPKITIDNGYYLDDLVCPYHQSC